MPGRWKMRPPRSFTVFGLNGFLGFLPQPPVPDAAGNFLGALAATGYMFPLIKGTEILSGLLLLSGRYVPLALTLLAQIVVNIVAFHVALAPAGMGMALAVSQSSSTWRGFIAMRSEVS